MLRFPAVADKSFLIHIGDRTVGGLSVRDQLVGPWQVPVSDVAITATGYEGTTGEAMAMGERTPLAVAECAGVGPHGGCRSGHQYCGGSNRRHWRRSGCPQTGWPQPVIPARMPTCLIRSKLSATSFAAIWASRFRLAKTRCPCARAGPRTNGEYQVVAPVSLIVIGVRTGARRS